MIHKDCFNNTNISNATYSDDPRDYLYSYDDVIRMLDKMINDSGLNSINPYSAASNVSGNN